MEGNLTKQPDTGAGKLLPAEVRVLLKIRKSLTASTQLVSESSGFLGHCAKLLLAKRQGGSEEAVENYNLFMSNIGFVRAGRLHDPEGSDFSRERKQAVREISRELRKVLGTEALKLAETIGKLQLPAQVRQALVVFKTNETLENRASLIGSAREAAIKPETVNIAATVVGEHLVIDVLTRGLFPDDYTLILAATRIYETLAANGLKLGLKSWHEPNFTVSNLKRLFDKALEQLPLLEFVELTGELLTLAKFLQSIGGRQATDSGISPIQINAIIGEYAVAGGRQWHNHLVDGNTKFCGLRSAERSFAVGLGDEAAQEAERAFLLLSEALESNHPFQAIQTIDDCLNARFTAAFELDYGVEMLSWPELSISESHETLALTQKAVSVAKRAQETRERIGRVRHTRNAHETIVKLSRQAAELERFALALEIEAGSRVVTDFSGPIPMVEGEDEYTPAIIEEEV